MCVRFESEVEIPAHKIMLKGRLLIPEKAESIILFSHGSFGGRFSTYNRIIARYMNENNFGTLLFDLLTADEADSTSRFDIELLADRLIAATEWLKEQESANGCRLAYFGASTGASSALKAASCLPEISAIVSRDGRMDLVADDVEKIESPTLLIVGSTDYKILELNNQAYTLMNCEKSLEVIPGTTQLFQEPEKMNKVAVMAGGWFERCVQRLPANQNKTMQE